MPQIITGFDKYAQDARANKTLKLNEELARSGEVRAQAQDTREDTRLKMAKDLATQQTTAFDADQELNALRKKNLELGTRALESKQMQMELASLMTVSGQVVPKGEKPGGVPLVGYEAFGRSILGKEYDDFAASGEVYLVKDPKTGMFTNATFDNGQGDVRTFALNDPRLLETIGQNAGTWVGGPTGIGEDGSQTTVYINNKTMEQKSVKAPGAAPQTVERGDSYTPEQSIKAVDIDLEPKLNKLLGSLPRDVIQYLPQGKPVTLQSLTTAIIEAKADAESQWSKNGGEYAGPFDGSRFDKAADEVQKLSEWRAAEIKRTTGSQINGTGGGAGGGGGSADDGGYSGVSWNGKK